MQNKIETLDDLIELMQEIADNDGQIGNIGFDMKWPQPMNHCGSACCIGGWINHVNGTPHNDIIQSFADVAKVPYEVADEVCFPKLTTYYIDINHRRPNNAAYNNATAADAVKVLTALRDTGKVIWPDLFPMKESV